MTNNSFRFRPTVKPHHKTVLGLMSGTSMDGIDAAIILTDGDEIVDFGEAMTLEYDAMFKNRLSRQVGHEPTPDDHGKMLERDLTLYHVKAVRGLLKKTGLSTADIDLIGFHGHTVLHRPDSYETFQIGDGQLLAAELGVPVIADFRTNDMMNGGQGAPLVPVFHAALSRPLERPLAIVNIGGVANVTWISPEGGVVAFDTGPGNALLDDWMRSKTKDDFDQGGRFSATGTVDAGCLKQLLTDPYFQQSVPKSLDRDRFSSASLDGLSAADGAATLTAFTAQSIAQSIRHFPAPPLRWLVTGGGRKNLAMMAGLRALTNSPVEAVESVGWQGDALEAQAFGFLAMRSLRKLVYTYPQTTGVKSPQTGGVLYQP